MTQGWANSFRLNGRGVNLPARSPFAQGFALLLIAVGLVLLVPLAVAAVIGGLVLLGARRVRTGFRRLRAPNGALDGRRNVRVRISGAESAE